MTAVWRGHRRGLGNMSARVHQLLGSGWRGHRSSPIDSPAQAPVFGWVTEQERAARTKQFGVVALPRDIPWTAAASAERTESGGRPRLPIEDWWPRELDDAGEAKRGLLTIWPRSEITRGRRSPNQRLACARNTDIASTPSTGLAESTAATRVARSAAP